MNTLFRTLILGAALLPALASPLRAQLAAPVSASPRNEEELVILTPFEVSSAGQAHGYTAATTLAGNRLNTQLRDVGSAVTVVTEEFLRDLGATDNRSLLQYTVGTEVGGLRGNFAGLGDGAQLEEDPLAQNSNTRVRGLSAADNTRDYFRSDIPWDAYNVERVELQRGANSILFGQGSPGGIINTGLKSAQFRNFGEMQFLTGSYGTLRATLDANQVLLPKELALRVALLHNDEKYRQRPAFSEDSRVYAALRYEPRQLNRGHVRTTIKANFEHGSIRSNAPRMLPPTDAISPWFTELGQRTYDQYQAFDHLSGRPGGGQWRVNLFTTGGPNPDYEPWAAIFGYPTAGNGPSVFMPGDGSQLRMVTAVTGPFLRGGLAPDGSVDGQIAAIPDNGWIAIQPTGQWAINARAPYAAAGLWKNNVLTDSSVFDFYKRLIDGDTKRERQGFGVGNLSLAQTYFDNRFGLSVDLSKEKYDTEKRALLPGDVRLQIDPIHVYGDGSPDTGLVPGQRPYADGTPNPNLGRAFVSTDNTRGNASSASDRRAARATGFVQYDFNELGAGLWQRVLGTHTLTGLVGRERVKSDTRRWQRYGIFDNAAYSLWGREARRFTQFVPVQILYLGDSLLGRDLAGAALPTLGGEHAITSGQIRYFDSTWNAPGVDPGALWMNGFYLDPADQVSTQSENPANYVGWTTTQLDIVDAEQSAANRARLTTRATLDKNTVESHALVWQGKWLDNSVVSTIGWRRDVAQSWAFDMTPSDFPIQPGRGALDLSPSHYRLPSDGARIEIESRSYSLVAHLNDLPFLRGVTSRLPVDVSVFYNRSTNFKPDASRVDIYGERLAAPSGKTVDRGLRIETKDGRYSLRVTRYETSNTNASSAQINAASIGQWMQFTQDYANVFEYNIRPWAFDATAPGATGSDTDIYDAASGDESAMRYNFHFFATRPLEPGELLSGDGRWIVSPEREKAVIDATRAFQRSVDPRFWQAWRINTFGDFGPPNSSSGYTVPAGFTITEDNLSDGWEIELAAQPTQNWRLMLNASQTQARRVNVGNANMRELMGLINAALEIPGGVSRLHHYYGTEDVVTAGKNWWDGEGLGGAPGSEWRRAELYENTTVPELRKWRVNLVSNYELSRSALKGLNLGAGLRYQSSVALGFPPTGDPDDPRQISYNFGRPYMGPAETNVDLWLGYTRQLTRKLHWRIQLNIKDAFEKAGLVPITYNPNGHPAAYRITSGQSWSLVNSLSF